MTGWTIALALGWSLNSQTVKPLYSALTVVTLDHSYCTITWLAAVTSQEIPRLLLSGTYTTFSLQALVW